MKRGYEVWYRDTLFLVECEINDKGNAANKLTLYIVWDKNKWLMLNRGISFEEIADVIQSGNIIEILENPTRNKQQYFIIDIKSYTWVVPFLINKNEQIVLKTASPSVKSYL